MELYPRLGKWFDIKTWTNCRMGMMGWGVLVLCYACKQRELHGHVTDGMLVSVALMHLYIFKFFLYFLPFAALPALRGCMFVDCHGRSHQCAAGEPGRGRGLSDPCAWLSAAQPAVPAQI